MGDDVPDWALSLMGQYGLVAAGVLMVGQATLAWSGRWRSWAAALPLGMGVGNLNFFPFSAGLFGMALVFFGLSVNADVGFIPGSAQAFDSIGVAFAVVSVISMLWWPRRLAPGWHRDWVAWGGPDDTDLWPTYEEREQGRR